MLVHWIWLATRPGVSDRQRVALMERFADAEDVYFADRAALSAVAGLPDGAREALLDKNLTEAERILAHCAKTQIHLVTLRDAAYPEQLKNIADPPAVLYYKGMLPDFSAQPVIGVVGTRKASLYGMSSAKRLGYQIGSCGGIVVSGMAYGIDGMAMRGALSSGQMVVGVLGCGVDVVYPRSNRDLYADLAARGCLLSEFPPGTPPAAWNFPKRNRIISGIACGVLVVEAPEKSGALITARCAAEQGRDVFVVPGNIDVASCAGSNALLRDGAIAVSSGWDVVSEYEARFPGKLHRSPGGTMQNAYLDEADRAEREARVAQKVVPVKNKQPARRQTDKKAVDSAETAPYSDKYAESLTGDERTVAALLTEGTLPLDDLIDRAAIPTSRVLAALTMLRVKGLVDLLPGGRAAWKRQKP